MNRVNLQAQIDHKVVISFKEFLQNKIFTKGRAFTNTTGLYYHMTGQLDQNVTVYASPYRPLIYDASISGATIITGVSGNGTLINKGTSGLSFDYDQNRILFTTDPGVAQFSGTFALADYTIKYTTKSEDDILLNTRYVPNANFNQVTTGLDENVETYPLVYINYDPGTNEGRALGGLDSTEFSFSCYCILDNEYVLDGVLGIMRDMNQVQFGLFDTSEYPFNISGDLNNINYNYTGLMASKSWPNAAHVEKVTSSKLSREIMRQFGPNIFIGVVDVECSLSRWPRQ